MMELTTETFGGGSVTKVRGALDGQTYQQFTEEVKKQIAADGKAILDFSSVDSVNAEGLRALLALNHWIKAKNGTLVVAGLAGKALEAFKSSGCDRLLKSYPDVNAAKQGEGLGASSSGPSPVSPSPVSPTPSAPARSTSPPVEPAGDEWAKPTIHSRPPTPAPSRKPPPAKKGGFPLLPIVGALLGLAAIAGLAILFWPKKPEPPPPAKPEIVAQATYSLTVGQTANIAITTQNVETLYPESPLPDGLAAPKSTGAGVWTISGSPTKPGEFQVSLAGVSPSKDTAKASLRVVVAAGATPPPPPSQAPEWIASDLPPGTVGKPYTGQVQATNGQAYAAVGLPPGLTIDARSGLVDGAPLQAGIFEVTLSATNQHGVTPKKLGLEIKAAGSEANPATPQKPIDFEEGPDLDHVRRDLEERLDMVPGMSPDLKEQIRTKIPQIKRAKMWVFELQQGQRGFEASHLEALKAAMSQPEAKAILDAKGWVWFSLGYANKVGGDMKSNLRLSDDRAQSGANAMASIGVTNTVTAVPMGQTDKFKARREEDRRVEIWAVLP